MRLMVIITTYRDKGGELGVIGTAVIRNSLPQFSRPRDVLANKQTPIELTITQ